ELAAPVGFQGAVALVGGVGVAEVADDELINNGLQDGAHPHDLETCCSGGQESISPWRIPPGAYALDSPGRSQPGNSNHLAHRLHARIDQVLRPAGGV